MSINRSLLDWGVFLIALGGVPLAVQQDWVGAGIAGDLWRLWPLILVGIGLGLILRWTPIAWLGGALVAGTFGLIFGALIAGGISGISSACIGISSGEVQTTEDSGFSAGSDFRLELELSCGELDVTRGTGSQWTVTADHAPDEPPTIEGSETGLTIRQGDESDGFFVLGQQTRHDWGVALPGTGILATDITLNAADGTVDLGDGAVGDLSGSFNASDVTLDLGGVTTPAPARLSLTFNASSGTLALPDGSMVGSATLNASSLTICVPEAAEIRVELESTLASDDLGSSGLDRSGDGWQTPGYDTAAARIDLSLTSTVSSISLERAEVCS